MSVRSPFPPRCCGAERPAVGDKIGRERRRKGALAAVRQPHGEAPRVQELTPEPAGAAAPSVHRVANDRGNADASVDPQFALFAFAGAAA
jgi:hypothetical protein